LEALASKACAMASVGTTTHQQNDYIDKAFSFREEVAVYGDSEDHVRAFRRDTQDHVRALARCGITAVGVSEDVISGVPSPPSPLDTSEYDSGDECE